MKKEAELDETATKRKKSGSTISAYLEQKLDKKSQEHLHIMLLQALIWGNISFNFVNNPFFIRFLSKLRPSQCGRAVARHVAEASATSAKFDQVAYQWHCQLRKGLPGTLAMVR